MKHYSLCTPLLILLFLVCATQSSLVAQVLRSSEPQGRVDRLTLTVDAPRAPRPCPAVIRFRGVVEMPSGGQVRYRWRGNDGDATKYVLLRLNEKEPRALIHLERVGKRGDKSAKGWLQLEVVDDTGGSKTARAHFGITCLQGTRSSNRIPTQGEEEENPQERLEQYLQRRGYTRDDAFEKRRASYKQLQAMRRQQGKPHRPAGRLDSPGAGEPGTVDVNNCAWSSIGPTNINGRVTQIAIDPTNNQRLFATTVGGVWRSVDGARRWQRVSDDYPSDGSPPTTVFASVAINPAMPSEVFSGSGDPNRHIGLRGGGIWRSTANGDPGSWLKVSPEELNDQIVYRLHIDPAPPDDVYVYAATSKGVYIGKRSGSSITFARLDGFNAWTTDIVVDFSVTPRLVYAGVQPPRHSDFVPGFAPGIWKYGTAWSQRNTGIPTANSSTIALAMAPSNRLILYAKVSSVSDNLLGVYKTTTAAETPTGGGDAWTTPSSSALDGTSSTFNSVLEVDPENADIVWGGGYDIYRTLDGGTTWCDVTGGINPDVTGGTCPYRFVEIVNEEFPLRVHVDQHAVAFDPTNSKIVYIGNDGGIFRSSNTDLDTWGWNNVSHNMVTTEFYKATSQQALAGIAAGGMQDHGTIITFGNRTWYWPVSGHCDGDNVAVDANASTLYGWCKIDGQRIGDLYGLTNPVPGTVGADERIDWTLPEGVTIGNLLVTDSVVAGAVLAEAVDNSGASRLLKTTDGVFWNYASPALTGSITAIGIGPSSSFQTFYIGLSTGVIWRTTNGGQPWDDPASWASTEPSSGLTPNVRIQAITVDDTNPARAIAVTGNGIFLTTDTGAHWQLINGNLSRNGNTGAVFDPYDANGVYAITDLSAFRGTINPERPTESTWTPFDEGLPNGVDVNDIWVNRANGILKIGTMGHGAFQRDVRPGIPCPSARLLVRDNVHDYGVVPSISGVPNPEHPIPDPARPGFYKPDDTQAGKLYWWESTDVRIDVPDPASKNQIVDADHVEMQTCPINVTDCPPGTLRDRDPQRGKAAKVYAQVTNTGLQPGTNVRVVALFADASTGLALLPADFWTTTFPEGSTTCGALDTSGDWNFVDSGNPCRVIPVVNPDVPEVVGFNWNVPLGQARHSCVLIITESVSDPLDPNIRARNQRRVSSLVPNNRQISLRNLHVVDVPAAGMASGRFRGFEPMNVVNPSKSNAPVELVFSSVDFPGDGLLGVFLPTSNVVNVKGAQPTNLKLCPAQLDLARQINVNTGTFYRITDPHEAVFQLPIPAGETWKIGVVYEPGEMQEGVTIRWSVLARQNNEVLGGNTYYIRPDPSLPGTPAAIDAVCGDMDDSSFFSVGLRAGTAIPHSPFNSFFDPSVAATVDLEYHWTNQFSVAGMFGYRRFSGPFSSRANIYQFAGGPKFYFTGGSVRPFVNGGVGSFTFDSGTTRFGVHSGGGLQFRAWPKVWFEGEYSYHSVFTSGSNVKYSTVQGGVRFRF